MTGIIINNNEYTVNTGNTKIEYASMGSDTVGYSMYGDNIPYIEIPKGKFITAIILNHNLFDKTYYLVPSGTAFPSPVPINSTIEVELSTTNITSSWDSFFWISLSNSSTGLSKLLYSTGYPYHGFQTGIKNTSTATYYAYSSKNTLLQGTGTKFTVKVYNYELYQNNVKLTREKTSSPYPNSSYDSEATKFYISLGNNKSSDIVTLYRFTIYSGTTDTKLVELLPYINEEDLLGFQDTVNDIFYPLPDYLQTIATYIE